MFLDKEYQNIFIVDSMYEWKEYEDMYDGLFDLVLTYDLELYKHIGLSGGDVYFTDHLVSSERMQVNNFLVYKFFQTWHYDIDGNEIFIYKDIPFGLSFRLEIWNDYLFYTRLYLSLSMLKKAQFNQIYLSSQDQTIVSVLRDLNIKHSKKEITLNKELAYYFPISQWLDEKIRPNGFRAFLYKTREVVSAGYGYIMPIVDSLFKNKDKKTIFIQEYHPSRKLLEEFRKDNKIRVLLANFTRGSSLKENFSERIMPIWGSEKKYKYIVKRLMEKFRLEKNAKLILDDGSDISTYVYNIIEKRISERMAYTLRTLDSSIHYLEKNHVDLEILIANIGHVATLFDAVCKHKNIPSYLIINGLLGPEFSDESKYATVINAYSPSIKKYYFRGMDNIVTLGDPRMDMYLSGKEKNINYDTPTITIGASGFNSTDLNSYVAVEFDFMHDVLSAFDIIKNRGVLFKLIIKVRGNGYRKQYENFIKKFFPHLVCEIIDALPMKEVLLSSDFYVSIYSQTLFEASCLGIPSVYYKKDTEIMNPPFDNNSELVTIRNINDMVQAFYDFKNKDKRYDALLNRKVMEKYIGPLDGKNLERNKTFVYELLAKYDKDIK